MADINPLDPNAAQLMDLSQQRKLADLLTQQGLQTPQGQMVSGQYVKSSPLQYLANMANLYAGQKTGEQATQKATDYANAIRQAKTAAEEKISNLTFGRPEISTELAGPYAGNVPQPRAVTQEGVKPDLVSALRQINDPYSYGAGAELKPLIYKQMMPEATPEEKRYKAAIADGSFKGGFNAFLNQMTEKDKASIAIDKQRLGLENQRLGIAQQQLAYDTGIGMPGGGQPMVGSQGGGQGGGQFAPKATPQYEYNPNLSPKQNQDAAGKFYTTQQTNMTNAKDSFDLMKSASDILKSNAPSSGRGENIITGAREFFGGGGEASKADASLNMLSGALTMKQPRFEGPQGVLDVTLYQKLAGDLGNPNIPIPSRLGTMKQMVDLQKKYYPNADWDSIKTEIDTASKVSLGAAPQYAVNPQTGERRMSTDGGKTWNPAR